METVRTSLAGDVSVDDVRVIAPLPLRLRIGVTGHQTLPDDPQLTERVREVIQHVQRLVRDALTAGRVRDRRFAGARAQPLPIQLSVVSALAEGADRLVAHEVLRDREAVLEAVLPRPERDYAACFKSEDSLAEFNALLAQAGVVWEIPTTPAQTPEEADEQGGIYVVNRCDVLIALWDGEPVRGPGGPAEVVALARQRGLPVFWVETHAPFTVHEERASSDARQRLVTLAGYYQDYNGTDLNSNRVTGPAWEQTRALATDADRAGLPAGTVEPYARWIFPYRVVAVGRARRYRRRVNVCGRGVYALSALAVACIALPIAFPRTFPEAVPFAGGELVCLLLILALYLYALGRDVQKRWITYRTLAEHLRSELFLRLVGVGDDRRHSVASGLAESDPDLVAPELDEWLARFVDEVRYRQTTLRVDAALLPRLTALLADTWIGGQVSYQRKAQEQHQRTEQRFACALYGAFGVALGVTLLHVLGVHRLGFALLDSPLLFVALILPGIFGALKGFQDQGEHQRNAERSRHTWPRLLYLQQRLRTEPDLQAVVRETADLLLSENRDWVSVMRYWQPELPV